MARVVNEEEYNQKRTEILNTAQKLVYTIGYEQMTIQDILNETKMSKGAFYHYFDSKADLLEALISHMLLGVFELLDPIIDNPELSGLEKLNLYFSTAATWKTTQKEFFISLMRSWYSDSNALVRYKINNASINMMEPVINKMICQAIEEGDMQTDYPEYGGKMIFSIFLGLGESLIDSLLSPTSQIDYRELLLAHTTAIERILGVKPGGLVFVDPAILDEWRQPTDGDYKK